MSVSQLCSQRLKLTRRVAQYLPGFEDKVRQALRLIVGEETTDKVTIGLAKDGSGVGAALAALAAKKAGQAHKHKNNPLTAK